jgi:hypothetical protein
MKSRMCGAIPSLPSCAIVACTGTAWPYTCCCAVSSSRVWFTHCTVSSVHLWILAAIVYMNLQAYQGRRGIESFPLHWCIIACVFLSQFRLPRGLRRGLATLTCWHCGSNPVGVMGVWCLSLLNVVSYQLEVSATIWSLVQRRPAVCVCVCVSLGVIRCTITDYTCSD